MTPRQWREERGNEDCWACDHSKYLSDLFHQVHHIASGVHRKDVPCNYLLACSECHLGDEGLHDRSVWPIERMLALKKIHDPKNYDRVAVNLLRSRQADAVTESEVDVWVRRMK